MVGRAGRRVVLVTGAIPGERVIARLERVTRSVAFATTVRVEAASPDRRPAFDDPRCGGCTYSHIAYPRQLSIKSEVIADAFARIGRLELPGTVTVAASPERGYRMRARLHLRGRRIGFFREGTHEICDARLSHQLLPETCDTLDRIAAAAASLGDTTREIDLSENVAATERVAHIEAPQPMDPRSVHGITSVPGLTAAPYVTDVLTVRGRPLSLRRHVLAFFQGNRYLLRDLVAHVAEQVPAGGSVLDLYAGVGVFAVAAAVLRDAHVHAVEGARVAAEDLRANGAAAGKGMTTIRADFEAYLAGVRDFRDRAGRPSPQPLVETVIVDPPRTGLSREALDGVLRLRTPRIVYVSCDVATLARDSRVIVDGGYRVDRADAFDLFPNTPHVETVVVFQGRAH